MFYKLARGFVPFGGENDNMNISNGIVWIVFDNHDKLVGCFTKEEFAKAACSGHTGWYYQGRHTVK